MIQSLDRGLILLETVAEARRPVSLGELTAVLQIDRSSVFRLASTLRQRGFLAQLPDTKSYVLGTAIWRLGSLFPWSEVLAIFAREQVAALAAKTQETTHLAVREGRQAALIHHQLTEQPLGVSTGSGLCVPLHCTSVGRALLIDYDRDRLVALLGDEPLATFNPRTIGAIDALADECQRSRERGFALDDQEYHEGVRCLAAPIRDAGGEVVASIGVSAPVERLPEKRVQEVGQLVMEAAREVGAKLLPAASRASPFAATLAAASAVTGAVVGNDTIKIALIGCGSRGTGAASQALATEGPVKLWAMADVFGDRLEGSLANLAKGEKADYDREAHAGLEAKIDVPPERRFVGFDAYQKAIDSGVDLVILATPPQFRPAQFEYAVKQGKHVFMEKPLAVDAPGIRQILHANEEAKQKNLKVSVGLMYRHNLQLQETIKRIQDGAIGAIPLLRCYWNMGPMRDTPPRRPEMSEMVYQLRNPYHFLWLSGDYFTDALLHFLDVCCWAKGAYPVNAQGQGGRLTVSETQRGDTYDFHCVEFGFADGSRMIAQTRQIAGCWSQSGAFAHGVQGFSDICRGAIQGSIAWRFRGHPANPYQVEHDVLFDAIRKDRPHNEVDHAAKSTMTAILGRMASYSGQWIEWETALQSNVRLGPESWSFDGAAPVIADATGNYPVAIPGVTKVF